MGTEKRTNVIINNIGYVHFACSEEVSCPVLQNFKRFVSVNCSVQRKRSNRNLVFLCLIDMNKLFEKHLLPLSSLHAVDYGFNNNKHTFA